MQELEGLAQEEKLSVGITKDAPGDVRAGSTKPATEITACPQNSSEKLLPQLPPAIVPYPKALLVLFWAAWGSPLPTGESTQKSPSLTRGRPAPSNSPPFDPMAKSA